MNTLPCSLRAGVKYRTRREFFDKFETRHVLAEKELVDCLIWPTEGHLGMYRRANGEVIVVMWEDDIRDEAPEQATIQAGVKFYINNEVSAENERIAKTDLKATPAGSTDEFDIYELADGTYILVTATRA